MTGPIMWGMSQPDPETLRIQHRSLTEETTGRLRTMIIGRQLQPGQRIRQAELAEALGVSTMPVREALLQLIAEGLVVAEASRSFAVADLSADDIQDMYWMQAQWQGELAARAWDRRTPDFMAKLQHQRGLFRQAVKANAAAEIRLTNWRFHAIVNRTADSPAVLHALRRTSSWYPDSQIDTPSWVRLANDWQLGLIREYKTGSREGARTVVHDVLRRAARDFISVMWDVTTPVPTAT
jgi:DNA-binding GntR family transcriptional regulator